MNELTQKVIARECAEWIREKARFKSINIEIDQIPNGMRIETGDDTVTADCFKNFDRKDLGYDASLFKTTRNIYHAPLSLSYLDEFDSLLQNDEYFRDVTEEFLGTLNLAHKEHSPEFLYYVMIYNLFSEFLDDINDNYIPNEHVSYKNTKLQNFLCDFQQDTVKSIISKLEKQAQRLKKQMYTEKSMRKQMEVKKDYQVVLKQITIGK